MPELKIGNKAPAINIPCETGDKINIKDYRGKSNLVLFFYPKDNTSGCTQEANDFKDSYKKFKKLSTEIIGISPDSVESHVKFIAKYKFPFSLLADVDKKVCEKYGVWVEKSMYGRKYMGVLRTTVLIDKEGTIQEIWSKVKVNGHCDAVLERLKELDL